MRKFQPRILLLSAALAASGAALAQSPKADALTEPQVRALLTEKGYTRIDDLDFEDGAWETDATSADGNRVDVRVDPATSRIYAEALVSTLSEDDVKAKLSAAGYSKVHDVDFDDGVWKAEAERADGNDVEIHLDPKDGHVLHVEND
ncbi:PepSY domain-containing protein [Pseudoxanthomonas sp. CF125]|uniref:PepSY domain-containing protein n=1 Tax=Pseudoxanthomonas sp. CF125 TaxID=1855303 RepID=UPI00088E3A0C|nr:PepSY domain-containing protein [Pseudoxanthomonas sp. CF125]SDR14927.1 Peptidase propeptide and YPEB domain-containing protein [Pseudoxanthomonas sp. CF125]